MFSNLSYKWLIELPIEPWLYVFAVVMSLAKAELERFGMVGWWPTFVTDAGANVRKALGGSRRERGVPMSEWSRCCCHVLHNVVEHGFGNLTGMRAPTHLGCRIMASAMER